MRSSSATRHVDPEGPGAPHPDDPEEICEDVPDELAEISGLPFPAWISREIRLRMEREQAWRRHGIHELPVGGIGFWMPDGLDVRSGLADDAMVSAIVEPTRSQLCPLAAMVADIGNLTEEPRIVRS